MPNRRFRKVHIICEDNQIFPNGFEFVPVFRLKSGAKVQEAHRQKKDIEDSALLSNKNKPLVSHKAEAFYLVHESLFNEILKPHGTEIPEREYKK